jgi:pyruvate/oxaloacetate carboxyltransferase
MTPSVEIHDLSLREAIGDFVTFHARAEELVEAVRLLDRVGFTSIDAFGGTTFMPTMKILGEDPWERLRATRRAATATPLQAVLRGRFVFASRRAADGTIRATLRHLRNLGLDRIKVADIGLDHPGAADVVSMAKELGFHVTAAISICWGQGDEASSILLGAAAGYAAAGADAVSLQDPFGILNPVEIGHLVRAYTAGCALPLRLHLHDTNLVAVAGVQAGLLAGARGVDTTVSPFSWAYSPPPVESILMALRGSALDPGLDVASMQAASAWLEDLKSKKGFLYRELYRLDQGALRGELPVAVRRALEDELRERGRSDLAESAWQEVPRVWEALGKPPFLHPLLRAVCSQAIDNVLAASPFERLDEKVGAYLRGEFGPPTAQARADLQKRAKAEEPSAPPVPPDAEQLDNERFASEDDRLTYALFPRIAEDFFRLRDSGGQLPAAPEFYQFALGEEAPPTVPRRLIVKRHGEACEILLDAMGPQEWGKRSFFVRIGGQVAKLDVTFPGPGSPPVYTIHHHGRRHQAEFVEVLPPGKKSVPVLLKEDGTLNEVLYTIPRPF